MSKPIMARATAVWLVDNTTLTFKQIADFVQMHELEVQGIADGDVATGVKGFDPVANNQLEQSEITAAEADPLHKASNRKNIPEQCIQEVYLCDQTEVEYVADQGILTR